MKEKLTDLVESIVDEKPVTVAEQFEELMLEKIRQAVADHEPTVAASLFDEEEVEEALDFKKMAGNPHDRKPTTSREFYYQDDKELGKSAKHKLGDKVAGTNIRTAPKVYRKK